MTDQSQPESAGVTRRNLMIGIGGIAGATAAIAALPGSSVAAAPNPTSLPAPEVLGAIKPFLAYIGLDALTFDTYISSGTRGRYFDDLTGVGALTPPDRLAANLPLPAGSVIYQLNVAYLGQPILEIFRRPLATPVPVQMPFQQTLAAGGGAKTQTFELTTPITVQSDSTYTVQYYTAPGATVYGVTIGYLPPTQAFIPFTGTPPRILDTREPSGGGKLNANEERTIALGFPGARGAVINLTVTDTEGAGFVSVNPANIAYPGNSSINWTVAGQNIANGVITALDPTGQIKIRGGVNKTHVVIDRIGWLI